MYMLVKRDFCRKNNNKFHELLIFLPFCVAMIWLYQACLLGYFIKTILGKIIKNIVAYKNSDQYIIYIILLYDYFINSEFKFMQGNFINDIECHEDGISVHIET